MGAKEAIEAEESDGLKSSPKLAGRSARGTSTFGDAVAAVLLQTMTGQGSQDGEQHPDETKPADQAVQARNPIRAATPTSFFRAAIFRSNARGRWRIPLVYGIASTSCQNESMDVRRQSLGLFLAFLSLALPSHGAEPLQFTVVGIDCKACAPPILKALKGVAGVQNARLDWKAGTATVEIPDGFDREKIRKALQEIGYEAVFPGEVRKDLEPLPDEVRRTLDISSASDGEKIEVAKIVVPGKVTVLDYWAEWCSPCHLVDIRLQHLVQSNPNLAVRRVNIGKWDNAAAAQATSEFRAEALPYVRVYDAGGKFVGDATGGAWDKILELVEKAKSRAGA